MLQPVSRQSDLTVESATPPPRPADVGTFTPLTIPAFRAIWIANLFANLGVWAQSVAAAWVVTAAHGSALQVAMIQVVTALPLVLLAIVTGVVADNYDRRRIMLFGMSIEILGGLGLTALAFLGWLAPNLLLVAILCVSIGAAITSPAWQAAVSEQVPRNLVSSAVLLNSVNFNAARAVGPALGGALLALVQPAWIFLLNCLCFAGLLWTLWRWHRAVPEKSLPPERIVEGIKAALHFTQYSSVTRLIMLRSFIFGLSASAIWALLPLLAHQHPNGSALLYGYLLGALGLGAIAGSTLVTRARRALGSSRLISLAALLLGGVMVTLGSVETLWVLLPVLVVGGSCWIAAVASYNASVQVLVPDWVKARALALYQTALYAGLSLGSLLWGQLADGLTVPGTLLIAGLALAGSALLALPSRLPELNADELTGAPAPFTARPGFAFNPRRGSVMVTIEYRIPGEATREFARAVRPLRRLRLRNGARRWSLYRDIADRELWQEVFLVPNWLQHLRMLDRLTVADRAIIERVMTLHAGGEPPRVRHGVSYRSARQATEAPALAPGDPVLQASPQRDRDDPGA
ncbi:putative MFS family arabinose efflux permease [Kushneria sinocarnis]|uniref:Putative MFS family arabinose efflux permease n=1 Tax=Kushneria sinocarnis TaxID=595502 RepID=A0A420X0U6_9GAMM|nr:MFS transporter [Kushneria sinocarnis]RKR07473.1 putative MFS family arabinose efflux permease [Kushneria sinocarnis]